MITTSCAGVKRFPTEGKSSLFPLLSDVGPLLTECDRCYDVCKGNTITPPTCTIPPVPEAAPVRGGLTQAQLDRMKKNAADRLAAGGDPCHEEDKSRCKPTNW
jgi:hypothetical protein